MRAPRSQHHTTPPCLGRNLGLAILFSARGVGASSVHVHINGNRQATELATKKQEDRVQVQKRVLHCRMNVPPSHHWGDHCHLPVEQMAPANPDSSPCPGLAARCAVPRIWC